MVTRTVRTFSDDDKLVEERRKQIALAATKLFTKKGYGNTSVRELAQVLGMSKAILYHYIGSKEDIVYLILQYYASEEKRRYNDFWNEVVDLNPREALVQAMRLCLASTNELQDVYNFVNHITASLSAENRQIVFDVHNYASSFYEKVLNKGIESGEFQITNRKLVIYDILAINNLWANWRWVLRKHFTLEEYANEQTEIILRAIHTFNGNYQMYSTSMSEGGDTVEISH